MALFSALDISASGLTAQRLRMDVTSANLANAQSTRTPEGGPYRRQDVVLQEQSGEGSFAGTLAGALGGAEPAGVEVAAIIPDTTPCARSTNRAIRKPTRGATWKCRTSTRSKK